MGKAGNNLAKKVLWECIKVYKIFGYKKGEFFTEKYMLQNFFYRKTFRQVRNLPLGGIYSINHPIAKLEFKKGIYSSKPV